MKMLVLLLTSLVLLAGCASTLDEKTYTRDQARRIQTVEYGTVEAINAVKIEGDKSGISQVAGGVVGGIAGGSVGGGRGQSLTTTLGAIAGAIAGGAIEKQATSANGVELTVRMDKGGLISVVQETDNQDTFAIGQRVKILRIQGDVRVAPAP